MTKAELNKAKAELKRLNDFIAKHEAKPSAKLKLTRRPDPVHGDKGYVLVEPQFDNPVFNAMFRKGPERMTWGANGRGRPRWIKEIQMYRVLEAAIKGF